MLPCAGKGREALERFNLGGQIFSARFGAFEAKAELEANGVTLADYDSILDVMAAETEPQTVLAESATVNYAVYQVLEQNAALTVKDGTDPLLLMK